MSRLTTMQILHRFRQFNIHCILTRLGLFLIGSNKIKLANNLTVKVDFEEIIFIWVMVVICLKYRAMYGADDEEVFGVLLLCN